MKYEMIKKVEEYTKEICRSKNTARKYLQKTGIYDKDGKLTKEYIYKSIMSLEEFFDDAIMAKNFIKITKEIIKEESNKHIKVLK